MHDTTTTQNIGISKEEETTTSFTLLQMMNFLKQKNCEIIGHLIIISQDKYPIIIGIG